MLGKLKAELESGHPVTGEYSSNAATAADQLNAQNISRLRSLSSADLLVWSVGATGDEDPRIIKIADAAASTQTTPAAKKMRALAAVSQILLTRENVAFDLSDQTLGAFVDALVAGGVLSAGDKQALVDVATETISRSRQLGLRVRPGTIQQARASK